MPTVKGCVMRTKFVQRNPFWMGFAAGLTAGAAASGVMLFLSISFGGVSLPEAVGAALTSLMPPPVFDYLHRNIGGDAKHYFFYGILVGQCLVFALSGALYHRRVNPLGQPLHWYQGLVLALILWLFVGLVLLPLTGAGIFGAQLTIGYGNSMLSLAVVGVVFGLVFVSVQNWLATRKQVAGDVHKTDKQERLRPGSTDGVISRRSLLKRGVIVAGIGLVGVGVWRFITGGITNPTLPVSRLMQHFKSKIIPPPIPHYDVIHPVPFLSAEITPNHQYYLVSKNLFSDPTVDATKWSLTVDGQVEHPFTLTYQQVLALPMKKQYASMMCISNEVGGEYMSNALWEGVPLVALLLRAGVKPGATKVVFHAADDYSDSIHLSKAVEPTTLMAVHMNGVTLPQNHGFPARMLVPGIYGIKHCKWLTRIEVVNYDYQGYWQQRGWSDPAP